jgi:hypothetical protein
MKKKATRKLVLNRDTIKNLTINELPKHQTPAVNGGLVTGVTYLDRDNPYTCGDWCMIPGRRPEGLVDVAAAKGEPIGAYFADACRMEAASVPAFAALREELVLHGAPADLIARADRAKEDEVRHARITATLARRFGAQEGAWAEAPKVKHPGQRSLEAVALENAVEGCVNETYAALWATWQGEHAHDRSVRLAMRSIAEDEMQHAALARSVAQWIETMLDQEARGRVRDAILGAVGAVVRGIQKPSSDLVEAGLAPTQEEQTRLVEALLSTLGVAWPSRAVAA